MDSAPEEEEFLGQSRLTRIGVRDDGKGSSFLDFVSKFAHAVNAFRGLAARGSQSAE
jgi:hypothetical protein